MLGLIGGAAIALFFFLLEHRRVGRAWRALLKEVKRRRRAWKRARKTKLKDQNKLATLQELEDNRSSIDRCTAQIEALVQVASENGATDQEIADSSGLSLRAVQEIREKASPKPVS